MNTILNLSVYAVALILIRVLTALPFRLSYGIGRGIGQIFFLLCFRYRHRVCLNLKKSYPDFTDDRIKRVAVGAFKNIGSMISEIAFAYRYGERWVKSAVTFEGSEHVREALKKGRGALLMTAHLGNWEIGAIGYGSQFPFNFVVRPVDNPYINRILCRLRGMFGNGIISKKNALREILNCLKRNETVGILMDQNVGKDDGVFVDFFGRKACTTPVIPILALRTGAPVLPAFAIRTEPGRIKIVVEKEIKVQSSGDNRADIQKHTELFTTLIESFIRKYPDQWFWLHRRWKTQPE